MVQVNGISNIIKIKPYARVKVVELYGIQNELIIRGKVGEIIVSGMNNKVINHKKLIKITDNGIVNQLDLGNNLNETHGVSAAKKR